MTVEKLFALLPKELRNNLIEILVLLTKPTPPQTPNRTSLPDDPQTEILLARLKELAEPLLQALQNVLPEPEKNIRLDVYKSFAAMLANELKNHDQFLHEDHIATWISAQKEHDLRFTAAEQNQIQRINQVMSNFQLSLESTYTYPAMKTYIRTDRAYLILPDKRVRTIETQRKITYEDLPQIVNHAFLMERKTEFSFTIL